MYQWSDVVSYGLLWSHMVWVWCVSVLFQDPVTRLKDLAELKDHLEEIQRKVDNEVQAGIPQVQQNQNHDWSGSVRSKLLLKRKYRKCGAVLIISFVL